MTFTNEIIVFTDGASSGNPGPGGWGTVVVSLGDQSVAELGGGEKNTTNNRMELRAVIEGLQYAVRSISNGQKIIVFIDSSYVKKGATQWLASWVENDWRSKITKKEILNKDLWIELDRAMGKLGRVGANLEWKLIGGHVGIAGNERCDEIATGFATGRTPKLFSGSLGEYKKERGFDVLNIAKDATLVEKKSSGKSHSRKTAYSYVSLLDGKIMLHKTWAECEARVKGKPARFKKAVSAEDEKNIIAEFNKS